MMKKLTYSLLTLAAVEDKVLADDAAPSWVDDVATDLNVTSQAIKSHLKTLSEIKVKEILLDANMKALLQGTDAEKEQMLFALVGLNDVKRRQAFEVSQNIKDTNILPLDQVLAIANLSHLPKSYLDNFKKSDLDFFKLISSSDIAPLHQRIEIVLDVLKTVPTMTIEMLVALTNDAERAFMFSSVFEDASLKSFDLNVNSFMWFLQKTEQERQNLINFAAQRITTPSMSDAGKEVVLTGWKTLVDGHYLDNLSLDESYKAYTWYMSATQEQKASFAGMWIDASDLLDGITTWDEKLLCLGFYNVNTENSKTIQELGVLVGLTTWVEKQVYINTVNVFGDTCHALDGVAKGLEARNAFTWLTEHDQVFKALYDKGLLADTTSWKLSFEDKKNITESMTKSADKIRHAEVPVFVNLNDDTSVADRLASIAKFFADYASIGEALLVGGFISADYETSGTDSNVLMQELMTLLGNDWEQEVKALFPTLPVTVSPSTAWVDFIDNYVATNVFEVSDTPKNRADILYSVWAHRVFLKECGVKLLENITGPEIKNALAKITGVDKESFWDSYKAGILAGVTTFDAKLAIIDKVKKAKTDNVWTVLKGLLSGSELLLSLDYTSAKNIIDANMDGFLLDDEYGVIQTQIEYYLEARTQNVIDVLKIIRQSTADGILALFDYHDYLDHLKYKEAVFLFSDKDGALKALDLVRFYVGLTPDVTVKLAAMVDADHSRKTVFLTYYACPDAYKVFFLELNVLPSEQWLGLKGYQDLTVADKESFSTLYDQNMFSQAKTFADIKALMDIYKSIPILDRVRLFRNLGNEAEDIHDHFVKAAHEYNVAGVMASSLLFNDDISVSDEGLSADRLIQDAQKARQMLADYNFLAPNPVVRSLVVGLDEQQTSFSYWDLGHMAFDIQTQDQKDAFSIAPFKDQGHNLHIAKDALMLYAVSSQMDSLLGLFSLFISFENWFGVSGYAVPHVDTFIEFFKKYTVTQSLDGDNSLFIPFFEAKESDSFSLFLQRWDNFFQEREFQGIDYFMNYFDWYNMPTRLKVTVDGVSYSIINGQLDRLFKDSKWNYDGTSLMSNLNSPMDFIPEVINMLCDGKEGEVDVTSALRILNMIPSGLLGQNLDNVTNIKHMVDTLKITMKSVEDYKIALENYGLFDNLVSGDLLSTRDQEIVKMIDLLYRNFNPTAENAQNVLKTPQSGDERAHSILRITPLWTELENANMFDSLIPTVDPILTGMSTKAQVDAAHDHAILMEQIKLVNLLSEHAGRLRIYANVSQGAENADIRAAKIWYAALLGEALSKNSLNANVAAVGALDNTLAAHGIVPSDIVDGLPVDTSLVESQEDRARKIELAIDLMPFYVQIADKKAFVARFISLPFQRAEFAHIKNLVSSAKITDNAEEMFAYAQTLLAFGATYKTSADVELALKLGKYRTPKLVKDLRDIGITAEMVPADLGEITQDFAMNIALQSFPEFRVGGETFESLSASLLIHSVTLSDLGFAHQFKTPALAGYTTYFKAFGNYILGVSAFAQKMGEHADADKIEQFMNAGMSPSDLNGVDMSLSANRIALELTSFLSTPLTVSFIHPNVTQIVLSEIEKQQIADQILGTPSDILAAKILLEKENFLMANTSFLDRQIAINDYIERVKTYNTELESKSWFNDLDIDSSCLEVESEKLRQALIVFEISSITPLVDAVKENVYLRALRFMIQNTYAGLPLKESASIDTNALMFALGNVTLAQIYSVKDLMQPLLMANMHTTIDERAKYIKDLIGLNAACEITGVDKSLIADLVGKVSKDDLIALHKFMPLATADAFITEAAKYEAGDLEPLMRGQTVSQYDWYMEHKDLFSALQKNHLFDALDGSPQALTELLTNEVWPSEITILMNMGSSESVADRAKRIIADVLAANPNNIPADILTTLLNVENNIDRHDMLVGYASLDHTLFAEIHAKKLFSNLQKWSDIKDVYDNYKTSKDDGLIDVLVKQPAESDDDMSKYHIDALKGYTQLSDEDKVAFKELAAWSGKDYEDKVQNIFAYIYEWENKYPYDSTFKVVLEYYKIAKQDGISDIFKNLVNVYDKLQALETYGLDNEWSGIKQTEHSKFIEAALTYKVFDGATHWWDSDYYVHDGVIQTFQGYRLLSDGEASKLLDPSVPQASRDVLRSYLNVYYAYAKDRLLSIPVTSIKERQDLFNGYAGDGNSSVFNMLYDEGMFTALTVAGSTKWSDIARIMDEYVKAGHGNQDRIKGLAVDLSHQAALLDGYTNDPNNAMFIYAYGAGMFQDWSGKLSSWDDVGTVLANFASMKTNAPNDLPAMLNVSTAKQKREYVGICVLAIQNNVLDKLTTIDPKVADQEPSKRNSVGLYSLRSDFVNAVNAAGLFDNMASLTNPYDNDWRNNYLRLIGDLETLAGTYSLTPIDMIDQIKDGVDTTVSEDLVQRYERIEMAVFFHNSPLHKALFANVVNEYAQAPYNLYANLSDGYEGEKALLTALNPDVTAQDITLIAKYVDVESETGTVRADRIKRLVEGYKHAARNGDVEALILGNQNSLLNMNAAFNWYHSASSYVSFAGLNGDIFHAALQKGFFDNLKNGDGSLSGIANEYMLISDMIPMGGHFAKEIMNAPRFELPYQKGIDRGNLLMSFLAINTALEGAYYHDLKNGVSIDKQALIEDLLKNNLNLSESQLGYRIRFCLESADPSVMAGHASVAQRSAYILSLIANIDTLLALDLSGSGNQDELIKQLVLQGISYQKVSAVDSVIGSSESAGEEARLRHIKMAIAVVDNNFHTGIIDDQGTPDDSAGMGLVSNLFLGDGTVSIMPEQIAAISDLKPLTLLSVQEQLQNRIEGLIALVVKDLPAEVMALFDDSIQESFSSKVKRLQLAQAVHYYQFAKDYVDGSTFAELEDGFKASDVVNALFADGITPDDIVFIFDKVRAATGQTVAQRVARLEMGLGVARNNFAINVTDDPLNVAANLAGSILPASQVWVKPAHIIALGSYFPVIYGDAALERAQAIIWEIEKVQALEHVEFKEGEFLQDQVRRIKLAVELDRSNLWSNLSGEEPEKAILNALMEANINPSALYDLTLDCINTNTSESVETRVERISLAIALKANNLELNAIPVGTNYIEMINALLLLDITPEQLTTGVSFVDTASESVEQRINKILAADVIVRTGLASDLSKENAKALVSSIGAGVNLDGRLIKISPSLLLAMSLDGKFDSLVKTSNRWDDIYSVYALLETAQGFIDSTVIESFHAQAARASMAIGLYDAIAFLDASQMLVSPLTSEEGKLLVNSLILKGYTSAQIQDVYESINVDNQSSEDRANRIALAIELHKGHFDSSLKDGKTLKDLVIAIFPVIEELDVSNAFNTNGSTLGGYSLAEPLTLFRDMVVTQADVDRGYVDVGGENIGIVNMGTAWVGGFQIPVNKTGNLNIALLKTFTGNGNPTLKTTKAVLTVNPGVPEITPQVLNMIDGLGVLNAATVGERVLYLQDLIEYDKAFESNGIYDHLSDGSAQTDEDKKLLCNRIMEILSPKPALGGVDAVIAGISSSLLDLQEAGFNERGDNRALRVVWALHFGNASLSVVSSNMVGSNAELIYELVKDDILPTNPVSSVAYVDVSASDTPSVRAQRLAMAMAVHGDGINDLALNIVGTDMVNMLIQEGVLAEELYGIRTLFSFNGEDIDSRVGFIKPLVLTYRNILDATWLNFNFGIGKMASVEDKKAFLNYFGDASNGSSRRDAYDALKLTDGLDSITTFASLDLLMHPITEA